jgi:hypothetical protein
MYARGAAGGAVSWLLNETLGRCARALGAAPPLRRWDGGVSAGPKARELELRLRAGSLSDSF